MSSFYEDASLVMIPSGYKTSKVYCAKPTDGTGDLTFTRSNDTATRVASNGLIEKVRTNLFTYSEQFDNAAWTKADTTIVANAVANPLNGAVTADKITDSSTATAARYFFQSPASSGTIYTSSGYFKKAEYNFVTLHAFGINGALFNLDTGVKVSQSGGVGAITSVGDGWYRCTFSFTAGGSSAFFSQSPAGNITYTGTTGSGIFAFGCQLETGDIATDYIPTTTAAVSVGPVANVPRLDYLNSSCPRLILEPQRTNKALYSEQFDNAGWTKSAATITANAVTSPDGYTNADSFLPTATTSAHSVDPATILDLLGVVGTFSVFAKYNGYHLSLSIAGTSSNWTGCVFDLQNGIARTPQNLGAQAVCTSKIEDYGNGWYRCSITYTPYTSGTFYNYIGAASTNNATLGNFGLQSFAANGTSGAYLYGAQVETSAAYATSYIPTLGASVTRGADNTLTASLSGVLPQTAGTMFWEIDYTLGSTSTMLMHNTGVSDYGFLQIGSSGVAEGGIYESGVMVDRLTYSGLTSGTYKMAFAYETNSFALYINGVLRDSGTSGSTASISMNTISLDWNSTDFTIVNQTLLFPTRLTNAQLAELTA